jgi:hypothetical protein
VGKITAGQDFGQAIAQPKRLNEVALPGGAFTATSGLMSAGRMMEAEEFAKERDAANAQKQAERDALHAQEKADTARAAARLGVARDRLQDLTVQLDSDIQSGVVPKGEAEKVWMERSTALVQDGVDTIPESHRSTAQESLSAWKERLSSVVQRSVKARNQSDTGADLETTLEHLQRASVSNYDLAKQQSAEAIDSLGPAAGWSPEKISKRKQAFIEGASYTRAFTAVNLAKNDNKALGTVEKQLQGNEDLDPQRKAQLFAQIEGYKANNEARALRAAQHGEIVASRNERESARAYDTLTGWAMAGKMPDPAANAGLIAKLDPMRAAAYKEMAAQIPAQTAVALKPMDVQRQELDQLRAQAVKGTSPELEKAIQRREKILSEQEKSYKDEPLRAGAEYGVIDAPAPLDLSSLDGLAQSMAARVEQAKTVQTRTGTAVSPLMSQEASRLGDMLATLPPSQQGQRISQLAGVLPAGMMSALAKQIDPKNRGLSLAMSAGIDKTSEGRTVGELILRGQQVAKDKGIKEDTSAEFGLKATLAKRVDGVVNGPARDAIIDAARFIYLGKQGAGESVSYEGALNLAMGGPIVEHNGTKLPVPAGVDLPTVLSNYPTSRVPATVYLNGQPIPGEAAAKALPGAQLEPAGKGKYRVRVGGYLVSDAQRKPVVIDVLQ